MMWNTLPACQWWRRWRTTLLWVT